MPAWLVYSLLAMFCWAFWAFLPRLSMRTLDPMTAAIFQQSGAAVMTLVLLGMARAKLRLEPAGIAWAVTAGILGVLGLLFYFQAASRYRIGVVVLLTALYPMLTVILGQIVLREKIGPYQWAGMALALVAIALMSMPTE